jgi:2-dehydropantoate 2-reductase
MRAKEDEMRICVFGTGAIGGLIAARLARAGEDVTIIDKGPHLSAIKKNGITRRRAFLEPGAS